MHPGNCILRPVAIETCAIYLDRQVSYPYQSFHRPLYMATVLRCCRHDEVLLPGIVHIRVWCLHRQGGGIRRAEVLVHNASSMYWLVKHPSRTLLGMI